MAIMEVAMVDVKNTSTFIFKDLYGHMHDFLFEEGYAEDPDAKFPETYYWESRTQTKGREYWIWWRLVKKPYSMPTKHIKVLMHIDFHGVGVRDVEIMYQGKKIKANKGKLEVIIRGFLEIDPGDKMKKGFLGSMRDIWMNKYWRKERDEARKVVLGEIKKIRNFAADFLNKPVIGIKEEPFFPRQGYEREDF